MSKIPSIDFANLAKEKIDELDKKLKDLDLFDSDPLNDLDALELGRKVSSTNEYNDSDTEYDPLSYRSNAS
jgi:hypothetical protein